MLDPKDPDEPTSSPEDPEKTLTNSIDSEMVGSQASFDVSDERMQFILKALGLKIRKILPESFGFMLMTFQYGEKGNVFYISSAEREDVITALEEFVARQKFLARESGGGKDEASGSHGDGKTD